MRARRSLNWEPLGNALGDLGGLTVLDGALPCGQNVKCEEQAVRGSSLRREGILVCAAPAVMSLR